MLVLDAASNMFAMKFHLFLFFDRSDHHHHHLPQKVIILRIMSTH